MVDLPPELWQKITSFLEEKYMKPLLGACHLLRDLALDSIYEQASVDIGILGQREYLDRIGRLGHPDYTTRVRKLCISTPARIRVAAGWMLPRRPKVNARTPLNVVSRLRNLLRGRKLSKAEISQKLLLSFVNLRAVQLHCPDRIGQQEFEAQMPLLLSTLQAYSSALTSIELAISPLLFLSTLLSTLPTFPTLERLCLKLEIYSTPNDDPVKLDLVLKDAVAPFIKIHRQTLSAIQVLADSYLLGCDLSNLFDNLDFIPHLKTLEIPFELTRAALFQSLHGLLQRHSKSLEDLVLYTPFKTDNSSQYTESCFAMMLTPLPRLKNLIIYAVPANILHQGCVVSESSGGDSDFAISMIFMESDNWNVFAGMDWSCLISMCLKLAIVTPAMFDAFSNDFPSLRSLSLGVSAFQNTFESKNSIKEFCAEMSNRTYPEASLTSLYMSQHHYMPGVIHLPCISCFGAVVEAFPSLLFMNWLPRATFLHDLALSQHQATQETDFDLDTDGHSICTPYLLLPQL
ncbi:hypothetical protein CPB83DRAFT_862192 [Crepidotus variabilis]|uniref:F-box domain-containing protein n=1 Tax=Crepidotus variabilis TaxID=179855 RepID=A0A9P6JK38_9AGAR|nr:hypothetical protein CPB83DRAFT_862192 [Crepidotus variabilis]